MSFPAQCKFNACGILLHKLILLSTVLTTFIYIGRENDTSSFNQLIEPKTLLNDALLSYYDEMIATHPEIDRTYIDIQLKYYWKRMFSYIEDCQDLY